MSDKSETKKLIMRVAVVIGVLIIPLAYSLLYLGAFWDPYDKMEEIPVAIVNLDEGAEIDGVVRNLGDDMEANLKDSGELKFTVTSAKKAHDGVVGNDYYASVTVPADFSKKIKSASDANKMQGELKFEVNEKKNFLASQILNIAIQKIEKEVVSSIDEEITANLTDKLKEVPNKLGDVSDGFKDAEDGSNKLAAGANDLNNGLGQLKSNGDKLVNGIGALDQGMGSAVSGIDQILAKTAGLDQLAEGASKINASVNNDGGLKQSLAAYTGGVDAFLGSAEKSAQIMGAVAKDPGMKGLQPQTQQAIGAFLQQAAAPETKGQLAMLKAAGPKLNEGANALAAGTNQLAEGTKQLSALNAGLEQLKGGITDAKNGTSQLAVGSAQLGPGLDALSNGGNQLADGASKLAAGLKDGKSEVDKNIEKIKKDTNKLNGIDTYVGEPVEFVQAKVSPVPNYGTAFAPYFMSLSLWVGGLILFVGIYLDIDRKFPTLSRDSDRKVVRSFGYLGLALAQALVLAFVIKLALGLEVANMAGYVGATCLVSMVFISIIQFCMVNLGDAGKLVVILLLIFQLTSCGGTFPMETVPKIFNVLYPFMPMTYSVALFKEAISGATGNITQISVAVLVGYMVVMMAATILLVVMKKGARELRKARKAA